MINYSREIIVVLSHAVDVVFSLIICLYHVLCGIIVLYSE